MMPEPESSGRLGDCSNRPTCGVRRVILPKAGEPRRTGGTHITEAPENPGRFTQCLAPGSKRHLEVWPHPFLHAADPGALLQFPEVEVLARAVELQRLDHDIHAYLAAE